MDKPLIVPGSLPVRVPEWADVRTQFCREIFRRLQHFFTEDGSIPEAGLCSEDFKALERFFEHQPSRRRPLDEMSWAFNALPFMLRGSVWHPEIQDLLRDIPYIADDFMSKLLREWLDACKEAK